MLLDPACWALCERADDVLSATANDLVGNFAELGIATAAAGMYPGEAAELARVSPSSRYQIIERTMRGLAHREPTFALHVHVGVPDAESAIRLMNRLRAHLPVLLALSAS